MEIAKDQLVIIHEEIIEAKEGVESATSFKFGAMVKTFDDMYMFAKDGGGMFILYVPCETKLVIPVFKNEKPVLVKKTLTGKYKFPKVRVKK